MKVAQSNSKQKEIFKILPDAITALKKNIIDPFFGDSRNNNHTDKKLPLRSELFTEEQLEKHAIALAKSTLSLQKVHQSNCLSD